MICGEGGSSVRDRRGFVRSEEPETPSSPLKRLSSISQRKHRIHTSTPNPKRATHRRPTGLPLSRAQLLKRLLQDEIQEHVVSPQDARHSAVGLDVDVDAAVHVLRGEGVSFAEWTRLGRRAFFSSGWEIRDMVRC